MEKAIEILIEISINLYSPLDHFNILIWSRGGIPSGVQGLILALCSDSTSGKLGWNHTKCRGLNLNWPYTRQMSSSLYCIYRKAKVQSLVLHDPLNTTRLTPEPGPQNKHKILVLFTCRTHELASITKCILHVLKSASTQTNSLHSL